MLHAAGSALIAMNQVLRVLNAFDKCQQICIDEEACLLVCPQLMELLLTQAGYAVMTTCEALLHHGGQIVWPVGFALSEIIEQLAQRVQQLLEGVARDALGTCVSEEIEEVSDHVFAAVELAEQQKCDLDLQQGNGVTPLPAERKGVGAGRVEG